MTLTTVVFWLGLGILASVISFGMLWLMGMLLPSERPANVVTPQSSGISAFLFKDELLFDHDSGALPQTTKADTALAWPDLLEWLSGRFAGLPRHLDDLAVGQPALALPRDSTDTAQVQLLRTEHSTRVVLSDPPHACPAMRHAMLVAQTKLEQMTNAFQTAPYPIWTSSADGTTLWQNAACTDAFDADVLNAHSPTPDPGEVNTIRFSIPQPNHPDPRWFEVHSTPQHGKVIHHATDITKILRAESAQKVFVQTLTKTFAYLTIGLAVFDRNRQLALFNPALVDLTGLPAEFLSAQPDLMGFFDSLRNRQVMPEPRSYASWRAQITEVIESAQGGLYQETWSLPNDVTYRVTGRPHPDGAVAFLFEDISAEVMLARRYRLQLDIRQSVLDCLPEVVMVIGQNNVLSFCNTAATSLLGIDPDSKFADMTLTDIMASCHAALPNRPVWSEVEARLRDHTPEKAMGKQLEIAPGRALSYRIQALPGGARMLMLRCITDVTPAHTHLVAG
ncbi:PAS-domain containing protein [Roseovarius aestuarii]|nr:PAS-domain containing protein [Roseovarius aestuarii]